MADATVGILRTILSMDAAQFEGGSKKASTASSALEKRLESLGRQAARLAPQAARLSASVGKELPAALKVLIDTANRTNRPLDMMARGMSAAGKEATASARLIRGMSDVGRREMQRLADATKAPVAGASFLTTRMVALGAAAGTFGAQLAGQAIRSLINWGKESFNAASQIVDLSSKTGLTTRTIQRMQFVADQTGTSLEAMTDASFRLGARLAGNSNSVKNAVRDLGLEWQKLRQLSPDEQFETVVTALGKMQSAGERNRLGMELFGRSFATIAAAVEDGYEQIADAATTSTDAQLRALDRAGDEWAAFVRNTKAQVRGFLGEIILQQRLLNDIQREQDLRNRLRLGGPDTRSEATQFLERELEMQRRLLLGVERREDIKLTDAQAQANETYAAKLAAVRAELAKLKPAERAEIAAAIELGTSLDELEDKFGLSEGALRIYTGQLRENEAATKKSAAETKAFEEWLSNLKEEIDKRALARLNADGLLWLETAERIYRNTPLVSKAIEGLHASVPAILGGPQRTSEPINAADRVTKAIADRWKELTDSVAASGHMMRDSFGFALGDMLFGARSFADGFLDIWRSIQRGLADIFGKILNYYLSTFIGGLLKGAGAASLGTAIGGGAAAGVAAGGAAAAAGGGAAVAGGAAAGGAGAALVGLATNPITIAAAGALAVGLLIGKKGLFRGGEEAMVVNPRRDQFIGQFGPPGTGPGSGFVRLAERLAKTGGSHLFRALTLADSKREFEFAQSSIVGWLGRLGQKVQSFQMGGFVPPNVTMPAILHGGSHGEVIQPLGPSGRMGTVINYNVHIDGVISPDNMDVVFNRDILPRQIRATKYNTGGIVSVQRRVL